MHCPLVANRKMRWSIQTDYANLLKIKSENNYLWGRIFVWLVSSFTRLEVTNEGKTLLFVCGEAVESKLVKLETSCTVIVPPMVSVL